ncbi:MAG TPA: helix-turn-helix transcriptional regulator [Ktedonobacteraceae bacterium]|nr:helix-turn-helix transcriptional regulator [Ktedonobacteraceae bacterium]
MKRKSTTPLKAARIRKSWTQAFVSSQIGVSPYTYARWESGSQTPRNSSIHALCSVFDMSPEELGFQHVFTQHMASSPADDQLDEQTGDAEMDDDLANLNEALALWTLGVNSCWHLYTTGNQAELERLLPTYLTNLSGPTLTPGPKQKTAASLTAQVYQLIALLELQHEDFVAAQATGTQALVYSQLAKDWNVYVASQIRLATIFGARKRLGSTLSAYNDALYYINAYPSLIEPTLQSWVFAGLGEIQAIMGREKEALRFLQLAIAVFPEKPKDDMFAAYAHCDRSLIYLYEGLIFLRLGRPTSAWEAFAQVDSLKPAPSERMRAEFLRHKTYTALALRNMIQSCIYLEAATNSARAIGSELALSEVFALYEQMLAVWGQESRVRLLAKLFQK